MRSSPELIAWACNTDPRLVKIRHPSDVRKTPWDRRAAPVTALRIRSPSAVSKWIFWLTHRGIASISQGLLHLLACSNAAKKPTDSYFCTSRVFPLPHAKDTASAVIRTAVAGNNSRKPVTRVTTNAPALQKENPSATPNTYAYCST